MQASEAALCEQDLFAPFVAAHKPPEAWRVGIEAEFFGVRAQDGAPLRYEEEAGVQTLFTRLTAQHGWQPLREHAAGPVVALQQGGASITLEPGAQVELSGSPWADVHAVAAELAAHRQQLQTVGDALGVRWLGLGFHPWATLEELGWVPKLRYAVMRRYLPTRGGRALDMMQRTCTVQVNLDYTNEQDALRKMTVALRLQPVVATLFANSPWLEGRFAGCRSERLQVWLDVDADRTGLLPFLWQGTPSYTRYVEWALDVPMFLIKRGAQVFANTGQSFRTFMREGFQGMHATAADWQTHLNTLFPEVRLKQTLEIRGVDGQSAALIPAVAALWKGLLYDSEVCTQLETMVADWPAHEVEALRPVAAIEGLSTHFRSRSLGDWGQQLLEMAQGALQRMQCRDAEGHDESQHLAPLAALLEARQTPADRLLQRLGPAMPTRRAIIDATAI